MDSNLGERVKIICIGNRYVPDDSLGMKVYDFLQSCSLPEGVSLIEGALSGLDLLPHLDDARLVIFVDSLTPPFSASDVSVLRLSDLSADPVSRLDHASSFRYLLGMIPYVLDAPLPEVIVLGASGVPDRNLVEKTARQAIEMSRGEA